LKIKHHANKFSNPLGTGLSASTENSLAHRLQKTDQESWNMEGSSIHALESEKTFGKVLDTKLQVLIAESTAEDSSRILQSLSELKECDFTVCNDQENLLKIATGVRPNLLLLSYYFIKSDSLKILNDLRHLDQQAHIIVHLPSSLEQTMNTLMMAGATECVFTTPDFQNVSGSIKKAIITISEREYFDDSISLEASSEEVPEIVFSLDLEGRCVYVNSAITHLLGYEKQELVNFSFSEFIANDIHREKFENFLKQSSEKVTFNAVLTLRTSLGIEEDFQVAITLMEGEILCGTAGKIGLGTDAKHWKNEQQVESSRAEKEEEYEDQTSSDSDEILPSHLGPYRVLSLLGEGSMGRVFKGFDEHLERYVAIKIINGSLASEMEHLERFKREARILASISHPNIALIYYFEVCNNLPFFCMEYLPEGSLDLLLKQNKVLDPETAILFMQQVAVGLKKAQEKGVVHLDIKPSNLMVAEKNRIKIVDFGLAATHCELQENSDTIVGTPAYLAPEQLKDRAIDHRCDIYSLGITFFELVYGCLPYTGKSMKEVFTKKLNDDIPGPEMLNAAVPMSLYNLIRKMVERDPDRRIQHYSELIDQLEETKRSLSRTSTVVSFPKEKAVRMRGNLYDTSFAEVLGEIWTSQLTGRLTLHWLDLSKVIHFRSGMITAVLSNQEGERFIDLLITEKQLKPNAAWKIQTARSDLFTKFSSAMAMVGQENQANLNVEFECLAWKILESLFSWVAGDFIVEEGEYPEQPNIQISSSDVIAQGVRHHTDFAVISRKVLQGKIKIVMSRQCTSRLRLVRLSASERFLLMKTDGGITFSELHSLSNLPREIFCRLIYLFLALDLAHIEQYEEPASPDPEPKVERLKETPAPYQRPQQRQQPQQPQAMEPAKEQKKMDPDPRVKSPVALADQMCRQAAEEYGKGNFWAAVQHCKKALEFKQDFRIHHLMGKALAKHQGFKYDAMKALKAALDLNPTNLAIQKDMADLYLISENIALAEFHYKKILSLDPRDRHSAKKLQEIAQRNDPLKVVGRKLGKLFAKRINP
jgi:PAS domain S-box-containing protein